MERVHRRKRRQPVKGIAGALLCHLFFFILRGEFVILLDPTARLARQLSVHSYPTYIYFDTKARRCSATSIFKVSGSSSILSDSRNSVALSLPRPPRSRSFRSRPKGSSISPGSR